jgi:hypothetical protein
MDAERYVADYSGWLLSEGENPDEDLGGIPRPNPTWSWIPLM